MRTGHAKDLLRRTGYIVKASQMGATTVQDTSPVIGPSKTFAKNEINGLSFHETTPWLQLPRMSQRNKNLDERKICLSILKENQEVVG